jgi:hypothetical protein
MRGKAHALQNFALGRFVPPHDGQTCASGVAHSSQNLALARFSVPQLGQCIAIVLSSYSSFRLCVFLVRAILVIVQVPIGLSFRIRSAPLAGWRSIRKR